MAERGSRGDQHQKAIGPYIEAWRDRALQEVGIPGGSDTVGYILVGLEAAGYAPDEGTDALASCVLGRQRSDCGWRVQTGRPPLESSDIEVTAVSLRALQAYAPKAQKAKYERAVRLARAWLEAAEPRSTEDRTFQLLGFAWAGTAREFRTKAGQALLKEQRPDDGWGQIPWLQATPTLRGRRWLRCGKTASWMPQRRSTSAGYAFCSIRNLKMDPGMFGAGRFRSSLISNRVFRTATINGSRPQQRTGPPWLYWLD